MRDLDRRRARAQNSALAGHTAPSIGSDEEDTIESVVESHVPEELRPERMTAGESQERNANSEGGEFVGLDLLDGEEALTPDSDALRNDGGSR